MCKWDCYKVNYVFFPGYTESLEKDKDLVVPDDDYGLYAIDILDPSTVLIKLLIFSC